MNSVKMAPLGFQTISAATLASAQSLTVPAGADMAIFSVTGASATVSWRDDFGTPTSTVGIILSAGDPPFEYTGRLSAFKVILAANSPVLNISYYKIAG